MEDQAEKWKAKYLETVDQLEKSERESSAHLEALRKCVVRVSLAAEGINPQLDEVLIEIRELIRKDAGEDVIDKTLEKLANIVLGLDDKKHINASSLVENLMQLVKPLEQATLSTELATRVKALTRHLQNSSEEFSTEQLLGEYTTLLKDAMGIGPGSLIDEDFSISAPEKGGVLSRMFGKNKSEPEPENPNGLVEISETVKKILLNLLDHLILPKEFEAKSKTIRQKLKAGLVIDDLPTTLDEIVSLVVDSASEETHEFEEFLVQINNRLLEVQEYLKSIGLVSDAFVSDSDSLSDDLKNQVTGMQDELGSAQDIHQLKSMIGNRLNVIVDNVDKFCLEQRDRQTEWQAKVEALRDRLKETEEESDQLREHLVIQRTRAQLDALTRLPNRQAYDHRIMTEFSRWQRYKNPLTILVCDIDHFKRVNDTFGHAAGDKVLKTVARVLQINIRETDFIARYGGEEFVIIMPETEIDAGAKVAEKLRSAIEKCPFHSNNQQVPVTISLGLAQFWDNDNMEEVFERADKALYACKEGGRNQVQKEKR